MASGGTSDAYLERLHKKSETHVQGSQPEGLQAHVSSARRMPCLSDWKSLARVWCLLLPLKAMHGTAKTVRFIR